MTRCKGIFIVGAKRTPFCKYGGPLRETSASHAFASAAKAAIKAVNLHPTLIDSTIVGNVHYLSQCDGGKTPRYCGIYSGVPLDRPALGVNKACGSGLQAVITGAVDIMSGSSEICLTGGTDIMSSMPLFVRNVRFGTRLVENYVLEDNLGKQVVDNRTGQTLQNVARDLAREFKVERKEIKDYLRQSYSKWYKAQESNMFRDELTNLTVKLKNKEILIEKDLLTQSNIALELSQNSEDEYYDGGINDISAPADGAAALILASEEAVHCHNLEPLAMIVEYKCVGVHPDELSTLIVIRELMKNRNIDLFEINDTSATESLILTKTLHIEDEKINVNGGTMIIGNPTAATGARIVTHLIYELGRRRLRKGIAASNCGGGQGVAILIEKM